ncbi:stomatin-like protein 2, mitochondrial [Acanthaster planci]|uniref:Stomatin-like protein 2, mitochondrial n=1 Tax=Acanthaster planci TaxID=133434 RepID=A0A8B7Z242_ACAPL|nr:stomatin-like protein 2, mitochondrial [Acanthaster planci]
MLSVMRNVRIAQGLIRRQCMAASQVQARHASGRQLNTVILFVPQQEAWVIERMGRFYKVLSPGLNFLIPVLDKIKYVQSLKEIAIDIPEQSAITNDNVTLRIDGVLYLRVVDPYKASYGVEDPEYAVTQLAQTTMRSEIGKITLDSVFKERESLNVSIVEAINNAAVQPWGIKCLRYEIKDIELPKKVQEAMQMQVEAERKKRAVVLQSEGVRESEINVAEGKKRAKILESEAVKAEQINKASGEAQAIIAKANARADALRVVAEAIGQKDGNNAASLNVAEQYVAAFSNLAKTGNTILLPSNTGDISSMVGQAMAIYGNLSNQPRVLSPHPVEGLPESSQDGVPTEIRSAEKDLQRNIEQQEAEIRTRHETLPKDI